jgi:hypothetical protein
MKKIILCCILVTFTMFLIAQTAKEDAISSLDTAKTLIQQNNLQKAQDEINFALSKISEIQAEELVKYIPDAPPGFKLDEKKGQGLGQMGGLMGSANAITAKGNYSKGDDISLELTISEGGMLGKTASLISMGQMYGGGSSSGAKSVRVNGYTGTLEFDAENHSGKLNLQVGEKISIIVEGNGIDNAEILKTLAGKIDLAKLEKAF